MKKRPHRGFTELLTWKFEGKRFDDHGVDLRDLADLTSLRELLVEETKELWRRANPDRENLPARFDQRIQLKIFSIEKGSATAVVYARVDEQSDQRGLPTVGDDVEIRPKLVEAAHTVSKALRAAARTATFPDEFPRRMVPRLIALRGGLADDEMVTLAVPGAGPSTPLTLAVQERLVALQQVPWEDVVDVHGEVTAANLRGQATIDVDGASVDIRFTPEQERTVTGALFEHQKVRLHITGRGQFEPPSGRLRRIVQVDAIEPVSQSAAPAETDMDALLAMIDAISKKVPDDVWKTVPDDGATNLDHYLYGAARLGAK